MRVLKLLLQMYNNQVRVFNMKHILIIAHGNLPIPNVKGGAVESLVQNLIDKNEDKGELFITVYSPYDFEAESMSAMYHNTRFLFYKGRDVFFKWWIDVLRKKIFKLPPLRSSFCRSVDKYIKRNQKIYDKIIFENNIAFLRGISRVRGNKAYYHIHNDWFSDLLFVDVRERRRLLDGARQFNKLLCVSDFIKERVERFGVDNAIVWRNGIRMEDYNPDKLLLERTQMREKLFIPSDVMVFMYSGRVIKEKGVKELVDAFVSIRNPKTRLLIVGGIDYSSLDTSDYYDYIKNVAAKDGRIIITGYVKTNNMPSYYACSDVVVIPTMNVEEACGLVAMEGVAAKKTLIVSDSGALRWWGQQECAMMIHRNKEFVNNLSNIMFEIATNKQLYRRLQVATEKDYGMDMDSFYDRLCEIINAE